MPHAYRLARLTALLLCCAAPARAEFSLAQVLSAPFPGDLTAAPAGARAAWIFNDRGARNLWLAEKSPDGTFHSRAITHYAGDDGVDMGDIAWAPRGDAIAYTRGGALEGGPPVNPLSLPAGPQIQTVFLVRPDGTAPRAIGPGRAPLISPRGDRIVFLRAGQIFTAPLAGGPPAQLVHDRGTDESLAFSPDGARLAFVSLRDGHSLIGVLDIAANRITWLAPSLDTDIAPEWSPDGARLAFIRLAAGEGAVDYSPHPTGTPWQIWVCDAATGAGHAIFTATPGPGSAFHAALNPRALFWTASGTIIFPWERTGFLHLYSLPASGGAPRALTPDGAYEIFNTTLSADRTRIAWSGNAPGDPDHWHIYATAAAGGAPQALTAGEGIEDYPVLTAAGDTLALHSTGQEPVRPVHIAVSALTDLAAGTIPADFPQAALVQPREVTFPAQDGLTIHGQLFLPTHPAPHAPAILFFHGGPYRQMLPAWHPMDAYSFMYGFNQYLAQQGYAVLSVNYRGGIGYGLDFREAPQFGAGGASELKDIIGAAEYMRRRGDIDPARLGIWGGSYGGLMTALGLARAPQYFAAGVDYAGVHDWRLELPQATGAAAARAWAASALSTMDAWRAPVLIAHADDDRDVSFTHSIALAQSLRAHHVPFEQLVLPDEVHVMLRAWSWLNFFTVSDAFFARHLGGEGGR